MLAFIAQATAADSLAIAAAAARVVDQLFAGLDPTVRGFLLGIVVFVIYQGWKWVVNPSTPPVAKLTGWWEKNKAWLNVLLPALLAWFANGSRMDIVGVISALSPAMVHGIKTAVVSVVSAKPTAAGQSKANAAAALLVIGGLLLAMPAGAETFAQKMKRFRVTASAGVVERWENLSRDANSTPSPRIVLQPGWNWNDKLCVRARGEWGLTKTQAVGQTSEHHRLSGEVGLFYVF